MTSRTAQFETDWEKWFSYYCIFLLQINWQNVVLFLRRKCNIPVALKLYNIFLFIRECISHPFPLIVHAGYISRWKEAFPTSVYREVHIIVFVTSSYIKRIRQSILYHLTRHGEEQFLGRANRDIRANGSKVAPALSPLLSYHDHTFHN